MAQNNSIAEQSESVLAPAPQTQGGAASDSTTELDQLRAERNLLLERQRSIMQLLNSAKPERILHDLRNILNERVLLRTLAGIDDDAEERVKSEG